MNKLEDERKKIDDLAKKIDSIGAGGGGFSGSMRVTKASDQSRTHFIHLQVWPWPSTHMHGSLSG